MMTTFHEIIIAFVALAVTSAVAIPKAPFCKQNDCPLFTKQVFTEYEIRTYEPSNWVATSETRKSNRPGWRDGSGMFMKLFRYIGGGNAANQKIKMTVPVLTKIETLANGQFEFTMMFYLPQNNPPAPTDPEVFLVTRPAGDVYVREFPKRWFASNTDYENNLDSMMTSIGDATQYNADIYYRAGYNSPYYWGIRQHEVWMDRL